VPPGVARPRPWAPAHRGRVASGPGPCPQSPPGLGMPGLREAALASARAPGRGRRRPAQSMPEWSGVSEAGQVATCRDGGDRPRPRPATLGWPGVYHWAEPPGGARRAACRVPPLAPWGGCGHRPERGVADEVRGGGGTAHRAPPAPVSRASGGPARIPPSLPQEQGVEAARGRLERVAWIVTRAAQGTPRVVLDRWDRDRREVPGAQPSCPLEGITPSRVDPVAGLLGDHGGGDAPAAVALVGQIARAPIAAGPRVVAHATRLACRRPRPEERVESRRSRPDRATGDDCRAIGLGHRGDGAGLWMPIQADVARVSVRPG
jgi:hypothetical protein